MRSWLQFYGRVSPDFPSLLISVRMGLLLILAHNMVFTLGLRHTFRVWPRGLALVQFL